MVLYGWYPFLWEVMCFFPSLVPSLVPQTCGWFLYFWSQTTTAMGKLVDAGIEVRSRSQWTRLGKIETFNIWQFFLADVPPKEHKRHMFWRCWNGFFEVSCRLNMSIFVRVLTRGNDVQTWELPANFHKKNIPTSQYLRMKPWNHRRNADMESYNGSRKEDFWNGISWCFLHKKTGDSFHSWPSGGMIRWPFGQLVKWPHLFGSYNCNFEVSLLTAQSLFRKSHLMSCHRKGRTEKGARLSDG